MTPTLSPIVEEMVRKQPLRAVEFDPPKGIKLLYKDGRELDILLGMDRKVVRDLVGRTFEADVANDGYLFDLFKDLPLSFFYDPINMALSGVKFFDVDPSAYNEEELRAVEVKAYFKGKSLLDIHRNDLEDWFENELDLITTGMHGIHEEELGFYLDYPLHQERASMISMHVPTI